MRIHLDTSFLVMVVAGPGPEVGLAAGWLEGAEFAISSIAWSEFLCGPASSGPPSDEVQNKARRALGTPLPFVAADAELAARLFNLGGRRSHSLADCQIAAMAIRSQARLATSNPGDFARFGAAGLTLLER